MRNPAAPRSGSPPRNSHISSSFDQPHAAGDPSEAASFHWQSSSPTQWEGPPQAASSLPLSSSGAASRSGSSPKSSIFSSSIEQPRAAGAPPEAASSLPLSSSPAQRELPQKQYLLFLYRAAPRSGSSSRSSIFSSSIEQPRAAGAPPEAASSFPLSSSPAQRELPQKQPPPSLNYAVMCGRSPPRCSLLPPPIMQPRAVERPSRDSLVSPYIQQPRAARALLETASSLSPSSSPAQRELPQKQPPPSLRYAASRSGIPLQRQPLIS